MRNRYLTTVCIKCQLNIKKKPLDDTTNATATSTIKSQQNSTSILMQMLKADWLSYLYTISHQSAMAAGHPRNAMFLQFFLSFERNFRCKQVIKFLRSLKEAHLRFLDFKNLKILKKWVRSISSISATLFEGYVQ